MISNDLSSHLRNAAVCALLFLPALFAVPAAADMVRIGGTGAALGTMKVLAAAAQRKHPDSQFEILPSLGTGGGLKAVARGSIDLAVVARELNKEERADGLTAFEYGKTPFVLATSKPVVAGLTLEQVADIYAGRTVQWVDGTPIRLILRPRLDTDSKALAAFSPQVKEGLAKALAREGLIVATTDQDAANQIERLPGALGPSTLALILSEKRSLVALPIEGVAPSVQAIATGRYAHSRSLYIVVKGSPSPATARFLDFVRSSEGRRILTDTGHLVVEAPTAGK
jgi:phosphate transport system substrate-binding protein